MKISNKLKLMNNMVSMKKIKIICFLHYLQVNNDIIHAYKYGPHCWDSAPH